MRSAGVRIGRGYQHPLLGEDTLNCTWDPTIERDFGRSGRVA